MGCHSEPKRMRMPFALLKVKNFVARGRGTFSAENGILAHAQSTWAYRMTLIHQDHLD
jgi:hypothetical protein